MCKANFSCGAVPRSFILSVNDHTLLYSLLCVLLGLMDLEDTLEVLECEVKEVVNNKESLKKNLRDLVELQHILQKTQQFFEEVATN